MISILCYLGFHRLGKTKTYEPMMAVGIVYYKTCSKCDKDIYVGELS